MQTKSEFTFSSLEMQLSAAIECGYKFLTCENYRNERAAGNLQPKVLVVRVDIDYSCKKARRLMEILNRLEIKATFFVRLHAPEYNPFSFENYLILRDIRDSGHEIGYHAEIVDQAAIWEECAIDCLTRDIEILNTMLRLQIKGVASHGGMTGLNNLDFWKSRSPLDFGLEYEAYEKSLNFNLFGESFYISDSEWLRWKCYSHGELVVGDHRPPAEHLRDGHDVIYLLIHPDTYFDRHFYE